MMKKKVKKIPKYNVGTQKVIDPNVLNSAMAGRFTTPTLQNTNPPIASLQQHSRAVNVNRGGAGNSANVPSVDTTGKIGTGINAGIGLLETATSGQDVTVGGAAKSTLSGAAAGLQMGGPVGAAVGAALGLAAGTAGRTNKVDYNSNSTNIKDIAQEGSGWLKAFGMSDEEMMKRASYTQNTNIGKIKTEQMRADYYSDPNNPNGAMALVAEGGVIRQPVDALVSKGELIYNPTTKKLSKVPGSKGKANNNDDVYAKLQEGDMIISNSPTMLMENGKTPAQNLEGLVDNNKNMKAKEAIIKKVVNWQEANRTKPQEYAMYDEGTPRAGTSKNRTKSWGSNWQDNLYRLAVLSQPLWDRAKAEPVDYTVPTYKYIPTGIDVSGQLRDVDQSYALSRYNFANLYPNTGAGMAAGLQAASNRAKQLADIRQYQTNAQNELIGKNVGIYNNWANEHARIMNSVYDKTAANRAAARNINRQNRAAALSNYGQMLRDDKSRNIDIMRLKMLDPMLQYGYENYDDFLKWRKGNGYD